MKAVNMTYIYKKYRGKWVALKSPTEIVVIAASKTLRETIEQARQKGFESPFMAQIPKNILPIAGLLHIFA